MRIAFRKSDTWRYVFFAGLAMSASWLHPADAADAQPVQVASADGTQVAYNDTQVETVTVSARRKSENEQDVPISLTAVSADTLAANGITNALKLNTLVPSLQVISFNARNT